MSRAPQRVKGTRDLLPPETAVWAAVEATAREVFGRYGYGEIRTPILEPTELFSRGVGEATDIVAKEMFTFADRKGRSMTLRPESTASVARAFIENGLREWPSPVKLFYIGPQFRYERPQKGRYRQFSQIGAEVLGDPSPEADAELLVMLVRFLRELGFESLEVQLNTLGDDLSRGAFAEALRQYLLPRRDQLGADSLRRLEINPLRILDTKEPRERVLLAEAPRLSEHLTSASRAHFDTVLDLLDRFAVPYRIEERLVRGLDYYTDTVFEIVSRDLGAQDAVVGGGRYDGLIAGLGGPEVPGLGFAIGEDRLVDVLPESFRARCGAAAPVLVVPVAGVPPAEALLLAEELRDAGHTVVAEAAGRSLKAALKRADRLGIRWVLLIGEEELAVGEVTVKDLVSGEQRSVVRRQLAMHLEGEA